MLTFSPVLLYHVFTLKVVQVEDPTQHPIMEVTSDGTQSHYITGLCTSFLCLIYN